MSELLLFVWLALVASLSVFEEFEWFNEDIEVVDEVGVDAIDKDEGLLDPLDTAAAMFTF